MSINPNAEVRMQIELNELRDENKRLRAALSDLRERSVDEGIHHFVIRIDAALRRPTHD